MKLRCDPKIDGFEPVAFLHFEMRRRARGHTRNGDAQFSSLGLEERTDTSASQSIPLEVSLKRRNGDAKNSSAFAASPKIALRIFGEPGDPWRYALIAVETLDNLQTAVRLKFGAHQIRSNG